MERPLSPSFAHAAQVNFLDAVVLGCCGTSAGQRFLSGHCDQ